MAILDDVRTALRIVNTALDSEINMIVSAGAYDLERVGITSTAISTENPTIKTALILYARAQFDFNQKGEAYKRAYEGMRDALSMCNDFNV